MPSDSELLSRYAREGCEVAFAEIVRTHIDLVYSAAMRRLDGNPHLAQEATQQVFVSLARHADRLSSHPVLNAWLYTCTRNVAANLLRGERRRRLQQQELTVMQELNPIEVSSQWEELRGILDPALDTLSEHDRRAILLRYFEGRSYPEISRILGMRDDAVRMRTERALEKLRKQLGRHGVRSTAGLVAATLSGHGVSSAPAGLAASIAVTATAAPVGSAAAVAGLGYFMSIAKTSAVIGTALVAIGVTAVIYHRASPAERSSTKAAVVAPKREKAEQPKSQAVTLAGVVTDHNSNRSTSPATAEAEEKIAALRDVLSRLPEQSIPELKLATNGDWHAAVDGPLETTDDYRRALAKLRSSAEARFARLLQPALKAYLDANGGNFPTDTTQLQSFVNSSVEDRMLRRYKVTDAAEIPNVRMGGDRIITQAQVVDSDFDNYSVIGPNGMGSTSMSPAMSRDLALARPVMQAFKAARGERFAELSELLPYATTPEQKEAIQRLAAGSKRRTATSEP